MASRGEQRLYHIRKAILEILDAGRVDVVVVEGFSYGSKGAAIVDIGGLGWVIRLALWERAVPYVEVPPACLKKYACGTGGAKKEQVLVQAVHRAGRTFADNNQADAWWLYQMGLAHYAPDHPALVRVPATHIEGLKKVPWVELEGRL